MDGHAGCSIFPTAMISDFLVRNVARPYEYGHPKKLHQQKTAYGERSEKRTMQKKENNT